MPSGLLYETDMRLRPNGNSGMLVSSLDAFERYQWNDAWTWEHQALLRARPVAGDPLVINGFNRIRQQVLCRERDPLQLRSEVEEMRAKMRQSLDQGGPREFDLKQGRGGIADIEFMVQYEALRWACQYPDILQWTDNIRLIEALSRHKILTRTQAETLTHGYRVLRAAYHRNTLSDRQGLVPDGELKPERAGIWRLWRSLIEQNEN
jgi:glutamate-ammonia-ligase adenylyltransferase